MPAGQEQHDLAGSYNRPRPLLRTPTLKNPHRPPPRITAPAPIASISFFLSALLLTTVTECPCLTNVSVRGRLMLPKEPVTVIFIIPCFSIQQRFVQRCNNPCSRIYRGCSRFSLKFAPVTKQTPAPSVSKSAGVDLNYNTASFLSFLLQKLSQHILQHAAIAIVIDLDLTIQS